ncbi:sulfite exporter TauE/SafE family protein [Oceanimonas sp. CHS3-5]|uniref:sulfite exporter TauE/SafE family protein n=1 Tax=Oceanimonas sp. CHS3-5 TaxID=3068186 RepID=UPI00273D1CFA|nr:sulfite exporter TauE/SafE family protein [Oceanimonas sp. CHS3-5]MDP5291746.1 sulfite exporter TauE/SafE family protein [Oceanimonas sp. CHS3-5]
MTWLMYMVLGAFAGTLAGLFGVGGGLIIVPVLIFSFNLQGIGGELVAHMAVGTSLATIVFTSLSAIHTHHGRRAIDWKLAAMLSAGIVVGAWLGGYTADKMSGLQLQRVIGLFAWLMSAQMLFNLMPSGSGKLPGKPTQVAMGGFIGWASGIFGIGGGSLTVPFLSWCSVPMQRAVAVSSACGFPIALVGALSYVVHGMDQTTLPDEAWGYVYLPALIGISVASMPFARVGAILAHKLSAVVLKRAFAVFLLLVGAKFLFFPA